MNIKRVKNQRCTSHYALYIIRDCGQPEIV